MPERFVVPEIFSGHRVRGFFTTKVSSNEISRIVKAAGMWPGNIYLPIQKHTNNVMVLEHRMEPKVADGVITDMKNVLVGVQTADCVPVLLYGRKTPCVGAVHAGWRGTAGAILKKTIVAMAERFGCPASEMFIAIGPAIRGQCYDVGPEVAEAVKKATGTGDYLTMRGAKYSLDLPSANRYQALSLGVPAGHIWMSDECTFCLPQRYYSYRYSRGVTGRQYGFIGMP